MKRITKSYQREKNIYMKRMAVLAVVVMVAVGEQTHIYL
jgi:hypothetical protein